MEWTIDYLRENGLIAYEYIRGSHAYGLNTETSDVDMGGVFFCPYDMLMGLRGEYVEQVSDEKSNVVYYEFGRWIELLLKSNPTALESLFIPKDCIIGKVHPLVQEIIDNRDMFLSKKCFNTFYGYAVAQIEKARGLNKKCRLPENMERKTPMDFCYTFYGQGSMPMAEWLEKKGLDQRCCGLANIPNMPGMYGVYYDWGQHIALNGITREWFVNPKNENDPFMKSVIEEFGEDYCPLYVNNGIHEDDEYWEYQYSAYPEEFGPLYDWLSVPKGGYHGIVKVEGEKGQTKSNIIRLSSIKKGDCPLCQMSYNSNGYESHCRLYKSWLEWKKNRNPQRYEENKGHNYDAKNMMHSLRLTRMAKELAMGQGFNVRRTYDRDFLLSIRNHEFEYEDIMQMVNNEKDEMEKAMENSLLPENVDYHKVSEMIRRIRKKYYRNMWWKRIKSFFCSL